ncbi:MAG: response regulator [Anaerolineae bacterium]
MRITDERVDVLRNALSRLYDVAYLENHPIVKYLPQVTKAPGITKGQSLRRILRLAIESLDPGPGVAPNARESRPYQILSRYYIAQHNIVQIADDLGICERQAYRELHRATEALGQILLDESLPGGATKGEAALGSPAGAQKLREEVERLSAVDGQEINLNRVLNEVLESARYLARDRGVHIVFQDDTSGLCVGVNRVMLRQAILNLLSHLIRHGSEVLVHMQRESSNAILTFDAPGSSVAGPQEPGHPYSVAMHLLDTLGIGWSHDATGDRQDRITLCVPLRRGRTVLIVDDNEGVIALFRRFLRHLPYDVEAAHSFAEALAHVERLEPDVILLDVMMPERDGWEVLQRIQSRTGTRNSRVIVCSIIDDPDLAAALGADGFLHKPVDRAQLVRALEEVLASPK